MSSIWQSGGTLSRGSQSGKPLPPPPQGRSTHGHPSHSAPPSSEVPKPPDSSPPPRPAHMHEERKSSQALEVPSPQHEQPDRRAPSPQRSSTKVFTKRKESIETLLFSKEEKLKVQIQIEGETVVWETQGEVSAGVAQEIVALLSKRERSLSIESKKGSIIVRDKKEKKDKTRARGESAPRRETLYPTPSQVALNKPVVPSPQHAFGQPLEFLLEAQKERYPHLRIPYFIASAFEYILARGLSVEGVFRLSGTSVQIAEFKDKLNRGEDVNWGLLQPDVHVVTGLVKLFLRELPEPLLLSKYYPHLMSALQIEAHEQLLVAVGEIARALPTPHLNLLMELITMCRCIAVNSDMNKMTLDNLARLMGPNILRTKSNVTDLLKLHVESENVNKIAAILLEQFPRYFAELDAKACETDEQPMMRFYCKHLAPVTAAVHALGYVWIADATGTVRAHSTDTFAVVHELQPAKGAVVALSATEGTKLWIATEVMLLVYALKATGPPSMEREIPIQCLGLCTHEKLGQVWASTSVGAVAFNFAGEEAHRISAATVQDSRRIAVTATMMILTAGNALMCFDLNALAATPHSITIPESTVRHIAVTPDSESLVCACASGRMIFINLKTLKVEEQSDDITVPILSAALHPDGGFVYAMTDTGVRVWQVGEAQMVREVEAYLPAPPSAIVIFRKSAPGTASMWVAQGQIIYEWIVRNPTRRPTRYSRPSDLITAIPPHSTESGHKRTPSAPHALQLHRHSSIRPTDSPATATTSPITGRSDLSGSTTSPPGSPPLSPERNHSSPPTVPLNVLLRRGSSAGRLKSSEIYVAAGRSSVDASTMFTVNPLRISGGGNPPTPVERPVIFTPNKGEMVKRVTLESKEPIHVSALFQGKIVLGGGEGSLYILDLFGNVIDVRAKAHPGAVSALLAVGTQLWSGSDDGMMHTWEMKERSLAEKSGSVAPSIQKKEGPLTKIGKKAHARWYVLKNEELFYFANQKDRAPKGSIQLAGARCEKLPQRDNIKKKEFFFCIGTGVGTLIQIAAPSDEDRNAWVSAIDAALKILNDRVFAHILAKRLRHGVVALASMKNRVAMSCKDETQIYLWDPLTMSRVDVLAPALPDGVKSTATRIASVGLQVWVVVGEKYLWLAEPPATVPVKTEHTGPIFALATTPHEQLVSISKDRMCVWDPLSASLLRTIDLRLPLVYHAVCVGPALWACGFTPAPQEVINIWNTSDWTLQKELDQYETMKDELRSDRPRSAHGCNAAITHLLPLPDGSVWSCSKDGSIVLWR